MADVFISYARADQAFAKLIAETLGALGLTVWWDRWLETGSRWDIKIEEELDAAKAVVVLWSRASVKSGPVRDEALEAQAQGKLCPVSIEPVKPPLFSRGIQFEDLSDWAGDTAATEFQDLIAQITALTGGVAAASHLPRDGKTAITRESLEDANAPILNLPWLHRPIGPFRSAASLVWSLLVLGFGAAMAVWREQLFGPYWEGVFLLAGTVLLLFLAGERELQPNVKAMVARWLRPQPDAKPIRSSEAFLAMFEAVFSKRHLSWRCLWTSAFASVGLYAALLSMFIPMEVLRPLVEDLLANGPRPPEAVTVVSATYVSAGFLQANAALLFLAVPLANILVDYLSLWETRLVLRWTARGGPLWVAVVLDAVLTGAIFVALLPLGPVAMTAGLAYQAGGWEAVQASLAAEGAARQAAEEIWRELRVFVTVGWPGEALSAVAGEANVPTTALFIAFVTTFTTSAWLWFAVIFAPVVRALSWTRRRGLSWLGLLVDTRRRPIAPLGYAAAAIVLMGGAVSSAVSEATALQAETRAARAPLEAFRDCAVCPVMVQLPGGPFLMGSPEDEPGRDTSEGPQTEITAAPFAIGRFEVTFREWDACVAATRDLPEADRCRAIPRGRQVFPLELGSRTYELLIGDQGWGRGLRPVVTVSWEDVQVYLRWLNGVVADQGVVYRLLSEAEWEYAARAGTTGPYSLGGDVNASGCDFMNGVDHTARRVNPEWGGMLCDDGYAFTAPVGSYAPNAFGLFDMHGNVVEWTQDCWNISLDAQRANARARRYGDCPIAVLRGGSWYSNPGGLRSAYRHWFLRLYRSGYIGFRIARTHVE